MFKITIFDILNKNEIQFLKYLYKILNFFKKKYFVFINKRKYIYIFLFLELFQNT